MANVESLRYWMGGVIDSLAYADPTFAAELLGGEEAFDMGNLSEVTLQQFLDTPCCQRTWMQAPMLWH